MHSCTSILQISHDLKIADANKTLDDELQGVAKKVAPHQKWFTWIVMAINNKNVNKSNVAVFTSQAAQSRNSF